MGSSIYKISFRNNDFRKIEIEEFPLIYKSNNFVVFLYKGEEVHIDKSIIYSSFDDVFYENLSIEDISTIIKSKLTRYQEKVDYNWIIPGSLQQIYMFTLSYSPDILYYDFYMNCKDVIESIKLDFIHFVKEKGVEVWDAMEQRKNFQLEFYKENKKYQNTKKVLYDLEKEFYKYKNKLIINKNAKKTHKLYVYRFLHVSRDDLLYGNKEIKIECYEVKKITDKYVICENEDNKEEKLLSNCMFSIWDLREMNNKDKISCIIRNSNRLLKTYSDYFLIDRGKDYFNMEILKYHMLHALYLDQQKVLYSYNLYDSEYNRLRKQYRIIQTRLHCLEENRYDNIIGVKCVNYSF